MLLAAFLISYPEFSVSQTPEFLVSAKLAEALEYVDAETWGTAYDHGHGLMTAHLLALTPWGQGARLNAKTTQTTYGELFERLKKKVACGIRL